MKAKQGKTNWKFILFIVILITVIGGGSFLLCKIFDCGTIYLLPPEEKSDTECQKYTADECPEGCIVCPPCEECSSFGCQSAEHCKSIGFDESWYYEVVKPQLGEEAKNCNEYEGLMSVEEINNCTCPEGYEKFRGLIHAYCATNSQKPCSLDKDCPEGEQCISDDGINWYCTGRYTDCYHDDPENPGSVICVD